MNDIVLKTVGLTKYYGGVHAFSDANIEMRRGEHVAIMGDNGAGKSTFMLQIAGVEQPSRRQIIFDGQEGFFPEPNCRARSGDRDGVPEPCPCR